MLTRLDGITYLCRGECSGALMVAAYLLYFTFIGFFRYYSEGSVAECVQLLDGAKLDYQDSHQDGDRHNQIGVLCVERDDQFIQGRQFSKNKSKVCPAVQCSRCRAVNTSAPAPPPPPPLTYTEPMPIPLRHLIAFHGCHTAPCNMPLHAHARNTYIITNADKMRTRTH